MSRKGLKDLATSPPPLPPRQYSSAHNFITGDSSSGSSSNNSSTTRAGIYHNSKPKHPPEIPPRISNGLSSSPPSTGHTGDGTQDDLSLELEFSPKLRRPSYSDISSHSPITFRKPKKPVIDDKKVFNKYKTSSYYPAVKRKPKPAPLNLATETYAEPGRGHGQSRYYHQKQQILTDDKQTTAKGNETQHRNTRLSPSIGRFIPLEPRSGGVSPTVTSPTLSEPSSLPKTSSSRTGSYTQLSSYFGFGSTSQERLFLYEDQAEIPKSPGNGHGHGSPAQFLIVYPSYARRVSDHGGYYEVDVRGWIYTPGVMGRKNRVILGMARQFLASRESHSTPSSSRNSMSASEYEQTGESGGSTASYRSMLSNSFSAAASVGKDDMKRWSSSIWSGAVAKASILKGKRSNIHENRNQPSGISSQKLQDSASRSTSSLNLIDLENDETNPGDLSIKSQSLDATHSRIKSRIAPFLAQPVVRKNVNIQAESENGTIDDSFDTFTAASGRFDLRMQLDYPPARIHINGGSEELFAIQQVDYVDFYGVSVISDIDDTVKHTGILGDRKTVFRNVFAKELTDVEIPGVRDWYKQMQKMGAYFHYVSNAPWQLYPTLKDFLKSAGLPEGSMHLKHYSGLWAGVLEPVLERKKAALDGILKDFPKRQFVLIGDSGEMDLEIYSIIAKRYPSQILAIYIRDITTRANQPLEQPDTIERKYRYHHEKTSSFQESISSSPYPVPPVYGAPDLPPRNNAPSNGQPKGSTDPGATHLKPPSAPRRVSVSSDSTKSPPPPIAKKPENLRASPVSFETPGRGGIPSNTSATPELSPNLQKAKSTTLLEVSDVDNSTNSGVKFVNVDDRRNEPPERWAKGHKANRSESTIYEHNSAALSDSNLISSHTKEHHHKYEDGKRLDEWRRRVIRAKRDLPPDVEFKLWRNGQDLIQDSRETLRKAFQKVPPFSRST